MTNIVPATTADLYAVVNLTKKKANITSEKSKETKSENRIYHVNREDSTASKNGKESDDTVSYTSDVYSKVDLSKKSKSTRNKVGKYQQTRASKRETIHNKHLKLNGKDHTHNCLISFAIVAVIASLLTIILIMMIIFTITYQKINSLEVRLRKTEVTGNEITSPTEQIKMNLEIKDAPEKSFLYLDSLTSPCLEIAKSYSNLSNIYMVASPTGPLLITYCDMNRTFGGTLQDG